MSKNKQFRVQTIKIDDSVSAYSKRISIQLIKVVILVLLSVVSIAVYLNIGMIKVPLSEIFSILRTLTTGAVYNGDSTFVDIIVQIRLPRALLAFVVGMSLGITGVVVQIILQNPMATPFTLGISSGAALGAAVAIIYPINFFGLSDKYSIVIASFTVSMFVSLLVLLISNRYTKTARNLILVGIAIMYFFKAVTSMVTYFADVYASREIVMWQVGSLWKADWENLTIVFFVFVVTMPYFIYKAYDLNKLSLGDELAKSLGVDVKGSRRRLMFVVALNVSTIVSFTGTISFVGLVVPHIIGFIIGTDSRFLLPASALGGGVLLVAADCLAINALQPVVLPVGVLTAFIGSPLFLYLIFKNKA